jgi:MFS family permease
MAGGCAVGEPCRNGSSSGVSSRSEAAAAQPRGVGLSAVFAVAEFRALWCAELLSVAGDQLARVALAVLVFDRTGSASLTALAYALTFVPAFVGGAVLGGIGDRYSRRQVMVGADVLRAVLIGAAAVPGLPVWALCVLVATATLLGGPFKAAQQALLPAVLPDGLYASGMMVRSISVQAAQLAGFAGGGLLAAALDPYLALAADAASFAAAAVLVQRGVRSRTVAAAAREARSWVALIGGGRLIWRNRELRALTGLCWLAGFYIVPEALAAPYAAGAGAGAAAVGALMASDPLGSVVGGLVVGIWVPEVVQQRALGVLGVAAGAPLALCVFRPPVPVAMLLFALSGAAATVYTVQATASFVRRLPDTHRAQGSAVLSSGLITVQGLGALLGGAVCDVLGAAHTIALAGACGAVVAVPIAIAWSRASQPSPRSAADPSGVAVLHDKLPSAPAAAEDASFERRA